MSSRTPLRLLAVRPLRSPGFTKRLLSELEIAKFFRPEEILYLTPNKRKARSAMFEILSLYKESASKTPECLTLQSLAEKLVSLRTFKGIVDERDRRYIFLKLIRESNSGFFSDIHTGLLSELYSELCRHYPEKWEHIPRLARNVLLDDDTERRLGEAIERLSEYDAYLERKGLIDHERLLSESLNYIRTLKEKLLLIEGYFEPWAQEQRLLKALLEIMPEAVVIIPEDPLALEAQDFFVSSGLTRRQVSETSEMPDSYWKRYRSREDEVVAIARKICALSEEGVKSDEIMVVFPALEAYRSLVVRVFERYGLNVNISLRPRLKTFPSIRVVLDILSITDNKFRRQDVVAILLAPSLKKVPLSVRNWIDVLSRDEGVISGATSWKNWFLSEPSRRLKMYDKRLAKEVRFFMLEFTRRMENLAGPLSLEVFSKRLNETLEWLGWDVEPELKRGLVEAMAKLKRMMELSGEELLIPRFAREALDMLLGKEVQINEDDYLPDAIRVLPVVESRWLDTRYLFLGGLIDGEFPRYPRRDLLLPERVKEAFSIPSRERLFFDFQFEFKRLESMPKEAVFLSAPSMEGERPLLASVFLVEREESPQVEDRSVYSQEEFLYSKPVKVKAPEEKVKFENAQSLSLLKQRFGAQYPFKVTLLEIYRNCPYRYYLRAVLKLEPPQEPTEEPEARLLGNVLHSVMERLMSTGPKAQKIDERLLDHLSIELDKMRLNPFVRIWIEDWLRSRVDWFKDEEVIREESGWKIDPEWLERDISFLFEKENFTIRGRVDRVDWKGLQARVLDYKTGKEQGFVARLDKGESLQLPLYCEIIKRMKQAEIESFGLYDFNETRVVQLENPENALIKAVAFAEDSVKKIRDGFFEPPEKKPQVCFYCEYKEFCS